MRKRLIHKDVVHIEGMGRERKSRIPEHLCAVNYRMHQNVLTQLEVLHLIPGEDLSRRHRMAVLHGLLVLCPLLLIDKVRDQHIQLFIFPDKPAQGVKHLPVSIAVHPVVAVHHLEKHAVRILQAGIDRFTVAAVLLVDGPADIRILRLILPRNLQGVVLLGTVIHDDNLHLLAARKQRLDAVSHIFRGIVTRNRNCQNLHILYCPFLECLSFDAFRLQRKERMPIL